MVRCVPYLYIVKFLNVSSYVPWAGNIIPSFLSFSLRSSHTPEGFSALRVFALTGGNYFLGIIIFILEMIPVAINSVGVSVSVVTSRC